VETFAETGGRPLGMAFDAQGNLIVADSWKGLLSITPAGQVNVLTTAADGLPFAFTDDLAIASDGVIYFSDASHRFSQPDYLFDLLEARPNGRLLRYDPATKQTTTLLDGLYFANGVALSAEEEFLLVNETYRYRITRYWLKGDKAGTTDTFIDNLPGFPDNISATADGRFWLALFTVRNPQMDAMHPKPWLKKIISRLPRAYWPKPAPYGFVVELDEQGRILRTLQDPGGVQLSTVTSAKEVGGKLYLGSLYNDRIGVLPLEPRLQ
jgi:sugar lactone lactonase YvrE